MTDSPIRRAPGSVGEPAPMQFKIWDSMSDKKSARNVLTMESEFQKYVSGLILSEETDILWFWKVKWFLWLNGILALQRTPLTG